MMKEPKQTTESNEEAAIGALRAALNTLPDAQAADEMRTTHRDSVRLALDSRGDPFGRDDCLVLRRSSHLAMRIPCRDLPVVVGRRQGEADHVLDVKGVSRVHFKLERAGPFIRIVDAGSRNGTFLNAERVTDAYLCEGDVITVGTANLVVHRA